MARYLISEVNYDKDDHYITHLKVHEDPGSSVPPGRVLTREKVIAMMDKGDTFMTVFSHHLNWRRGEDVEQYSNSNGIYLRTNPNEITRDNLGELPKIRG